MDISWLILMFVPAMISIGILSIGILSTGILSMIFLILTNHIIDRNERIIAGVSPCPRCRWCPWFPRPRRIREQHSCWVSAGHARLDGRGLRTRDAGGQCYLTIIYICGFLYQKITYTMLWLYNVIYIYKYGFYPIGTIVIVSYIGILNHS